MKSCINLAKELNTSKQTIFNHARRNNINLIKKNNTLYIESKEDIKTITEKVLKYKANKLNVDVEDLKGKDTKDTKQNKINDNEKELYKEIINSKEEIIMSLKKDKEDLNKQINNLNELLKQQQQLLYNQQSLTLKDQDSAKKKISHLEPESKNIKKYSKEDDKNTLAKVPKKNNKKGFLSKLFNKI
mgnify:CR=1 FL=1